MHKSPGRIVVAAVVAVVLALSTVSCGDTVKDTVVISATADSVIIIVTGATAKVVGGSSSTFRDGQFLVKKQ